MSCGCWNCIDAKVERAYFQETERNIMASREADRAEKDREALRTQKNLTQWVKEEGQVLANLAFSSAVGNGEQNQFTTGATRSTSEGKVDFEGHINPEVLAIFGDYMNRHRYQRDGQLRASDNWQQGIPLFRYVKSLIRHTFEFWRMWRGVAVVNPDSGTHFTFQDVLCALMFNIMGIIYEMNRAGGYLGMCMLSPEARKELEQQ